MQYRATERQPLYGLSWRNPLLRDNLAGLIEPMLRSAAAHNLGGHPERDKLGDAAGRPSWRSSLLSDPSAKFSGGKPATGRKTNGPVLNWSLRPMTPALFALHGTRVIG